MLNMEIKIVELKKASKDEIEKILRRGRKELDEIIERVRPIIEDVKKNGDKALLHYVEKFDHVRFSSIEDLRVNEDEVRKAFERLDPKVLEAIKVAINNLTKFHSMQVPKEEKVIIAPGIEARRLVVPLSSAGLYIPAGKYPLPSVVIHTSVPAKVAGVERIVMCSPPRKDGTLYDAIIVAADLCGVKEVYKMGGAHAIAALAYGTESIKPVNLIAGPGGPYVTAAKILVQKDVRIDLPAGPSEGMVLADSTADPKLVAADTISEAEHGPDSAGVLVTDSLELALRAKQEISRMYERLSDKSREFIASNVSKGYSVIIVTESMDEAISFVNEYAPEHLVIHTRDPEETLKRIKNAGTICLGPYTPITAGNYMLGPNAILPTGGAAKWTSGLSVDNFIKRPTVEKLTKKGLESLRSHLKALAEYEGFSAHINAVEVRFT